LHADEAEPVRILRWSCFAFVEWRRGDSCILPQDANPIGLERDNMACMALARLVRRLDNDFMESFRQAPMSVGAQEKLWCELCALQVSPMAYSEREVH
jgi:hypothetical protein